MAASQDLDVLVVGAGIAGLAAAIALDRAGIRVQVIEKATALTQAGTALSLWPNALAALELIGLSKAIAAIGIVEPNGTICEWSGREIMRLNQSRLQQRLGTPTRVVHRGDLQQVLLARARSRNPPGPAAPPGHRTARDRPPPVCAAPRSAA